MLEFLGIWAGFLLVPYVTMVLLKLWPVLRVIASIVIATVGVNIWIKSWATDALDFWLLGPTILGTLVITFCAEMTISIIRNSRAKNKGDRPTID